MSFPYTPAQIAAFRAAFETIVEAIEQGEKAKTDEQFISLMRGVEGGDLAAEKAKTSQVESHHSKDVFSFFPWFGKKKKIEKFSTTDVRRVENIPEPVKVSYALKEVPSLFHFESSDSRVSSRFFAGLPWLDDKSEPVVDSDMPSIGESRHLDAVQEKIENESQDTRITSRFFSELPWASNDSIASNQTGISVESHVEKSGVALDTEIPAAPVTPNRVEPNAKLFFSDLPWRKEIDKSIECLSITETPLLTEDEVKAEKTVTISLKDSKSVVTENTAQKQAEIAEAFFLRLPWEDSKNKAKDNNNTFSSNDQNSPKDGCDENLINTNEVISIAKDVYDDNVNSTANSFFSQLPWLKAEVSSQAEIDSSLVREKLQPTEENITRNENPLSGYFQTLPWQGRQNVTQSPEIFRRSVQNESEATGIFALATQSAVQASQKISVDESNKNSQRTERFFSALPWNGSR